MVRVTLPFHLCHLANTSREIEVDVSDPVTPGSILDALETRYPMLRGTIRDHVTLRRRPLLRYFACGEDFSAHSPDTVLPNAVADGNEPFMVVGAIAGG